MVSKTTYKDRGYTHQGWLTSDHRWLLMDDEGDERRDENDQSVRGYV